MTENITITAEQVEQIIEKYHHHMDKAEEALADGKDSISNAHFERAAGVLAAARIIGIRIS